MRRVIKGKTYNTETSKVVGQWWNGLSAGDFNHCCETLYRNTKGAYFIHGEGGPMSKYAKSTGQNQWSGGEEIIPMTAEEAQAWAEGKLTPEEYEAEFGEQEEAAPSDLATRERVNLTLDAEIMSNLRKLSKEKGQPMSTMVDQAILAMYGEEFKRLE